MRIQYRCGHILDDGHNDDYNSISKSVCIDCLPVESENAHREELNVCIEGQDY
jgi:hypothetical protein